MKKLLYKIKRYLTLDGYSVAPIYIQILLLLILSFIIISIASLYYGSFEETYYLFMDPTAIPEKGNIIISIIILLIGLIIASFVISILSSSLEKFIENIKKGVLPFKRGNHIVIINQNNKLFYILEELNIKYKEIAEIKEVVIILSNEEEVENLIEEISNYSNLSIFVKYGNLYDVQTYTKFSLNKCKNIILLSDHNYSDNFTADNNSIKIVSTLIQNKSIDFSKRNLTIEINRTYHIEKIYEKFQQMYNIKNFSYIDSTKLLAQLLERSIIDITYYKIYEEIFTFNGFEIYIKSAKEFIDNAHNFKDLLLKVDNAILIGYIKDDKVELNNLKTTINPNDELIFIANNEKEIILKDNNSKDITNITIEQPSEIVKRTICMLGDVYKIDNLFEFLDEDSKNKYEQYIFDDFKDYIDDKFIKILEKKEFDSIIINLPEEETLRFILILVSKFGKNSKFVNKCISMMSNPNNAKIINTITGTSNIILSERLSAQFISQLSFHNNLIKVINELTTSQGAEFNILDAKKQKLNHYSKTELKSILLNNEMIYIGIVKDNGEIELDSKNINLAKLIIVLSNGIN